MTHRLAWGTWGTRRLGVCAVIALAAGCNGGDSLSGAGGSRGGAGLGNHAGGTGASSGAGATSGTGASSGAGAIGGTGASSGAGAIGGAGETGGSSGTGGAPIGGSFGNNVDILIMIDNSSEMTLMQEKLYNQLPAFIAALESLFVPPSLHLAIVSSDMGAPGDSTAAIMCSNFGDQGEFQSAPRSNATSTPPVTCTSSTIASPTGLTDSNHTFISDVDNMPNFTDPLASVVQCIALLGDAGCGFEHQLASIDRALGADGLGPAPSQNEGFLRPNAYLAILMLTNEDDCSAPANTTIYSLNGDQQNISNPDGPIANYRCNGGPRGGHLCQDPHAANPTAYFTPPLKPSSDAQGTPPILDLVNCEDNETGTSALTPVSQFVNDIKALKPLPDNQILVAAIAAPATPYSVVWTPEEGGQNTQPGELWPNVMHSCGPSGAYVNPAATDLSTDGSFGDPAVRIAQFTNAFPNSVLGSICDPNFSSVLSTLASRIGQLIEPNP
jgi:hypothetical protein